MIECSTGITPSVTLSSAQLFLVYTGAMGDTRWLSAGGTGRLAFLHGRLPGAVHRRGRPAPAGRRDAAGLLRDPGAAVRGTRPCAADEPARRGGLGEQEPRLTRGGPAGGARLGPAGGLPHRPARPGRRADRRGLRGAGRHRPRPCRAGPPVTVRRADPGAGGTAQGDRRGDDRGVRRRPVPGFPPGCPGARRTRRTRPRGSPGRLRQAATELARPPAAVIRSAIAAGPGPGSWRRPSSAPARSSASRFWLSFSLASTVAIASSTPTIARNWPSMKSGGASLTCHGAGRPASCRAVSLADHLAQPLGVPVDGEPAR